ncbi:MAG: hypothetical protein M5U09_18020, partial [Gammaproteobacteria bacterium]|nr:hypothetical protein [Gammaproteobacteria bacterium]
MIRTACWSLLATLCAARALQPTCHVVDGDTVVAMAVATDPPWSADRTGRSDAAGAIQRAIDA